jgi:pimeloyl-ACP methyl ester carboxylesterase
MKAFLLFLKIYFNSIGLVFSKNSINRLAKLFSTPRKTVVRAKEIEFLESAKKSFIDTNEYKIAIYEWGKGNEYAILCHGWESNAGSLGAMVKPLIKKGFRVIAFDGPAHGKSNGTQASLIKFKETLSQLIIEFGVPKIAIGHSLGANAIMLAASEADLNIEKTILIAPVNKVSKVFFEFKDMINIPDRLFKGLLNLLESETGYLLRDLNFEDIAPKTSLKNVLILHDVDDQITPEDHSIDIAKKWNSAKYIAIKGSGHYRILWNESTLNEVRSFLS